MSAMPRQRTILITFAGRRDRMELLTRYVDRAIEAGVIDEWHVWDFSRNAADALWLRSRFPTTQVTPSHSLEYFPSGRSIAMAGAPTAFSCMVYAQSDSHVGLRRVDGRGASYEIVLGGWGKQASAIRSFETAPQLIDVASRAPERQPIFTLHTPNLLPEFGSAAIEVAVGRNEIGARVNGEDVLRADVAVEPGAFEIYFRTGYGANGEWAFSSSRDTPARRFVSSPASHFPADAMFYTRAYQYYGANRDRYKNDVFLKCDDDIVYFDIERLRDFIAFRRENPQYFLVSANVINNGVCAHFQQASGAIPTDFDSFELPDGGMCGSLWASGAKAGRLHALFLKNPPAFADAASTPIAWRERISINFVSWLGEDLVHLPDIMSDDEHDLCYGVRKRANKLNCVYPPFVAAHLSFWK